MARIRVWKLTSGDPRQPVFRGKIEVEGDFTRSEWERVQAMFLAMRYGTTKSSGEPPDAALRAQVPIRILMIEDKKPFCSHACESRKIEKDSSCN